MKLFLSLFSAVLLAFIVFFGIQYEINRHNLKMQTEQVALFKLNENQLSKINRSIITPESRIALESVKNDLDKVKEMYYNINLTNYKESMKWVKLSKDHIQKMRIEYGNFLPVWVQNSIKEDEEILNTQMENAKIFKEAIDGFEKWHPVTLDEYRKIKKD